MRPVARLRALLVTTTLACGACGPSIVMNPAGAEINPQRLVAMPSAGVEYGFDFSGDRKVDEGATRAAMDNVDASVNYRVSASDGRLIAKPAVAGLEGYPAFRHWSELVLRDVTMAALGRLRDPPSSVLDWHFRSGVPSWRAPLSADHVLITLFIDGHDSTGRAIAVAFAGGWTAGHRIATCAVRLADGRLVWCKVDLNMRQNITTRDGAQRVADGLLTQMLATASMSPHPESAPAAPPRQPAGNEPSTPVPTPTIPARPVEQSSDEEAP